MPLSTLFTKSPPLGRSLPLLVLALWALLAAAGCAGPAQSDNDAEEHVGEAASALTVLTSLAITPASATIPADVTQTFKVTATMSNGTTRSFTTGQWSTSAPAVASVSSGVAVSLQSGASVLQVRDPVTGMTASATLTVGTARAVSVGVSPIAKNIPQGTTVKITATAVFDDSTKYTLSAPVVSWTSSKPATATIDAAGVVTGVAGGVTTITATHRSGVTRSTTLTVGTVTLSSIQMSPATATIPRTTTQAFTAMGTYSDGSAVDLTPMATWTTSNTKVATIAGAIATGIGDGTATITASFNAKKATANLVVGPNSLKAIALTPPLPSTPMGRALTLVATGTYLDLTTRNISDTVTWSTSNSRIFTISNADGEHGKITPVAVGSATAKALDPATGKSASVKVTVTAVALQSIIVSPPLQSVPLGVIAAYGAEGIYSDGSRRTITADVTWTASRPETTVSNADGTDGQASTTFQGQSTITATDPATGVAATATLSGRAAVVRSLEITPAAGEFSINTTRQYQATGLYSDGHHGDVTSLVTWSSNDPAVVDIGNGAPSKGLARMVSEGMTAVRATLATGGPPVAATATVTVLPLTVDRIEIGGAPTIAYGQSRIVPVALHLSDGTVVAGNDSVTFQSSSPSVLAVSNVDGERGLVTALRVGSSDLTVTHFTGASATLQVTVTNAVLDSINIENPPHRLARGLTQGVEVAGRYSDRTTRSLNGEAGLTWESDHPEIAWVEGAGSPGLIRAVSLGTALIRVRTASGLVSPPVEIVVTETSVVRIQIQGPATIGTNEPASYRADATMSDGSHADITSLVTWQTSNDLTAVVSNAVGHAGEVTPINPGPANVIALDPETRVSELTSIVVNGTKPMVATSGVSTCALLRSGRVKCWGYAPGIGDDTWRGSGAQDMGANLPFVELGAGARAVQIAAGDGFMCAVLSDGRVKCWGQNPFVVPGGGRGLAPGQMGDALPAIDLGAGVVATSISAGVEHACALLSDATVKCWGYNSHGDLGLGDARERSQSGDLGDNLPRVDLGAGRTVKQISAGRAGTCALLDDDRIKCWGYASDGALGNGDSLNDRGDEPNEMGDALPAVLLGGDGRAKRVAVGLASACAILLDGGVKCWGQNYHGSLGLGDGSPRTTAASLGDNLPRVDLGDGTRAVGLGVSGHACALLASGQIKCWGENSYGQLGLGDTTRRGDQPNEMGNQLPFVDVGLPNDGHFHSVRNIAVAPGISCAVLDDDAVKCWGYDDPTQGRLGQAGGAPRGDQPGTMGAGLPPIDLTPCPFHVQNDPQNCRLPGLVCASGTCTNGACLACAAPPAQLVSWWRAEANASDSVGGANGTVTGGVTYAPGKVGQAFVFDGTGRVSRPAANLPLGNADRTLEAWVRLDAPNPGGESFFAGYGPWGNFSKTFAIGVLPSGNVFFSQWGGSVIGPALVQGAFTHIAVTSDNSLVKLYVDGVKVGEQVLPLETESSDFVIGSIPNDPYRRLFGAVDEASVYNRALSEGEIAGIVAARGAGKCQ